MCQESLIMLKNYTNVNIWDWRVLVFESVALTHVGRKKQNLKIYNNKCTSKVLVRISPCEYWNHLLSCAELFPSIYKVLGIRDGHLYLGAWLKWSNVKRLMFWMLAVLADTPLQHWKRGHHGRQFGVWNYGIGLHLQEREPEGVLPLYGDHNSACLRMSMPRYRKGVCGC